MKDFEPKWNFIKTLGEGGQAHTYLVESTETPGLKGVAKRLKDVMREPRLKREIDALKTLEHPNVLRLLDFGTTHKGKPYLVSAYCANGELKAEFFSGQTLIEIMHFYRQICDAVAAAHRKEIVHRDLKPSNIFLTETNMPVVGDFGICFLTGEDPLTQRITATQEVVASRWFGAPEARDGRMMDVKPSADVYSLGKILYWMVSRGQVFDREEHRTPKYRLNESSSLDPNFELIDQLLDKTITSSADVRLPSAVDLLYEVDKLISIMESRGHAITLEVPHQCIFCAEGRYEIIVNGLEGNAQEAGSAAQSLFGWDTPQPNPAWLIMVCDTCGNLQAFRPDLPPSKSSGARASEIAAKKKRWTTKRNKY
jgi:serine/threonine protein kinase